MKVYALADKLGDAISTNCLVDVLVDSLDETQKTPLLSVIEFALQIFSEETPIQQLFVDLFVYEAGPKVMKSLCESEMISRQFLGSVLVKKARLEADHPNDTVLQTFDPNYTSTHKCRYHQHDKDDPSCGDSCERGQRYG